jgi:hypothetical protein
LLATQWRRPRLRATAPAQKSRRVPEEVHRAAGRARPPQGPATCRRRPGVRLRPRHGVHVADAGEEEGGAHLQEDQADRVLRGRGDGVRREGQAEEDHRRQDQGADAVAQRRGGVRPRGRAGEGHFQDRHWTV